MRTIRIIGAIDEAAFKKFSRQLEEVEESGDDCVQLELLSEGGEEYTGLAFYGRIINSPVHITCTAYGCVMSAATLVFAACDVRLIDGACWFMVHDSTDRVTGDAAQVLASLGLAHERANATTEACAFRVASAELRPSDVESVAAAVACERGLGRVASAERWLASAKSEALRAATAAAATKLEANARGVAAQSVFGDIVVDATWDAGDGADLDLAIVDPTGTRVSWASRARNMRAADCTSRSHEALAIASFATGAFVVEVVRVGANVGAGPVRGTLRITSQGQTRMVPFVAGGARSQVARVDVGMDSRLVPANPEEIGARLAF